MEAPIRVDHRDGVAWVILNEPERRNPLTVELVPRMLDILDDLEQDDECRVVVITGEGPAFCAGADLGSVVDAQQGIPLERQFRLVRGFNQVIRRLRESDLPIIAAVNGVAVGGGAALAMACDFALAGEQAALMFAFGRIGATSADMGCTWLLPRIVGESRARHLLLTGARVDARRGVELGLFVDVVPDAELRDETQRRAEQVIAASSPRALGATKLALGLGAGLDLNSALGYEAYLQSYMFQTPDHRSRLAAFLEKE